MFAQLFFAPAGEEYQHIFSLVTIGLSLLFRPLGAAVAGRLGDRFGRKPLLVITLIMMGIATTTMGFLPTYDQIGLWAPFLLLFLRILQGFSAGGEWGGAVLMSVEYTPPPPLANVDSLALSHRSVYPLACCWLRRSWH